MKSKLGWFNLSEKIESSKLNRSHRIMRMKHLFFLTCLFTFTLSFITNAQQRSCFSADYLEQQKQEDPQRIKNLQEIERLTQEFIERNGDGTPEATVYTIPVVFHVVYNTAAQNISTAQIESQMTVLNDDFRRLNANQNNNWSQAADAEIEFCLATVDPDGNATDGITRTSTNVSVFSGDEVKFTAQGGKDAWPAGDYLNFWVCALDGFLGYAQFPGGPPATDGVVCDYRYTGTTGTATPPFNLGRTGTHEVGHWLNLYHIWGDGPCGQDDLVADTPESDAENYGCPNGHTSCGSLDMIENYMDYTDDACMNLFTQGQKTRMRALFDPGGFRASLLNSNGCNGGGGNTCATPTGLGTSNITNTSATASWNASSNAVSYNVQIAAAGSGNWTTTNVTTTAHTFTGLTACTSYDVRVQADCDGGDVSNYSSVHTFQTTGCPSGCQDNELTLTIVLDNYPSETTWEVKDGNTVLASGGPYSNANSTVTEDICVADGCYDFVIYDSYGDGICCAYGNGSYDLTVNSTGASVASGGQFGASETTNFCVPGGGNPCDVPTGLATSNITATGATASWTASANAVSYNVQIAAAGSGNWTTTNVSGTSHTFSGLTACTSYDVRVQADCGGGNDSDYTSVSTFQTTGCSGGCQDNELTLTIVLDDYPEETTWEVKDGNTVLASGGPYSNPGSTVTEDICVPDGCYDFVIYDSYGDGICCAYGNGSYNLTDNAGASLASGGQFGSSETTNFCVPGGGGGGGNCTYETINDHGFENGWGIWNDGGSDARRSINDAPYATTGDFCIRLRDNTNTSVMTTDNMNLTDYEELTVDFAYYVRSFENVEDFWLQISVNGGGSYQTVEDWIRGTDFNNNEFKTDQVVIAGPFTSNTRLRFRADASGNSDWVYIDDVVISGCTNNGNRDGGEVIEIAQITDNQNVNTELNIEKNISPEMKLFPNPVENELTINLKTDETLESHLLISDFSGKVMQQISLEKGVRETQINVSDWAPGFYLVQLVSGKERISKKFVVAR